MIEYYEDGHWTKVDTDILALIIRKKPHPVTVSFMIHLMAGETSILDGVNYRVSKE